MTRTSTDFLRAQAERLETEPQIRIMEAIPAFSEAEVHRLSDTPPAGTKVHPLVFNMERGVTLDASLEYLRLCPQLQPFDLILANELDDGCSRSGRRDVAREVAEALHMDYVFGLEFIELNDPDCGRHGNAIFSLWPILWAEVLRLPEEYNWFFDRQKRIGGRCAVFAKLDICGQAVGVVSTHLENRTDGAGRQRQMQAVLDEADRVFPDIPVIVGGDLNTNTFDGRNVVEISRLADDPALLEARIAQIGRYEPLMAACAARGYTAVSGDGMTRRKPLPQGGYLALCLDWILPRGFSVQNSRIVSTLKADCGFAPAAGALAGLRQKELSDHNVVWASLSL